MRYVDRKRSASDLVHRKNRDKDKEGTSASDPMSDFLSAALIPVPSAPAAPEPPSVGAASPTVEAPVPIVEHTPADQSSEQLTPAVEQSAEESAPIVELETPASQLVEIEPDVEPDVAAEFEQDQGAVLVETAVEEPIDEDDEDHSYDEDEDRDSEEQDYDFDEDHHAHNSQEVENFLDNPDIDLDDDADLEYVNEHDVEHDVEHDDVGDVQVHELQQQALDLDEQRYQAELDLIEQQKRDAERLGAQEDATQAFQERIATATAQLEALRKQSHAAEQEASTVFEQKSAVLEDLTAQHQTLISEIEQRQQQSSQSVARAEQVAAINQQIAAARKQVAQQEHELSQLRSAVPSVNLADVEIRNAELTSLKSRQAELQSQLASEAAAAEARQQEADEQTAALEQSAAQLRQDIETATSTLSTLPQPDTSEVDALESEIQELSKQHATLVGEVQRQTHLLSLSQDAVSERASELVRNRNFLLTKVQTGQKKLSRLESDERSIDTQSLEAELGTLNADFFRIKTQIVQARKDARTRERMLAEERARHQQAVANIKADIESARQELAGQQVEPDNSEVEAIRAELQSFTAEYDEIRKAVRIARSEAEAREQATARKLAAERARLVSLESRVDFEKQSLVNFQKTKPNDALLQELTRLTSEASQLQRESQRQADLKAEAVAQQRDLEAKIQLAHQELSELQAISDDPDAERRQAQLQSLTAEHNQIQKAVKAARAEAEAREQAVARKLSAERARLVSLQSQVDFENQSLLKLQNAAPNESLVAELDALVTESSQLNHALREGVARRDAAEAERQGLVERRDAVQAELAAGKQKLETLVAAVDLDSAEADLLRSEVESLQRELTSTSSDSEQTARQRADAVRTQATAYRNQIAQLQQEIASAKGTLADTDETDASPVLAGLQSQLAELQIESTAVRQQLARRVEEQASAAAEAKRREQDILQQRDELRSDIDAAHEKLRLIRIPTADPADAEIQKAELRLLAEERDAIGAQIVEQEELVRAAQQQIQAEQDRHAQQIADLKEEIAAGRETLSQVQAEPSDDRSELEETVRRLETEAIEVRSSLEHANQRLAANQAAADKRRAELANERDSLQAAVESDSSELQDIESQLAEASSPAPDNVEEIEKLAATRRDVAGQLADAKVRLAETVAARKEAAREREERVAEAARLQEEVSADWAQVKAIANELRDLEQAEPTGAELDLQALRTQHAEVRTRLTKAKAIHKKRTDAAAANREAATEEAEWLQSEIAQAETEIESVTLTAAASPPAPLAFSSVSTANAVSPAAQVKFLPDRKKRTDTADNIDKIVDRGDDIDSAADQSSNVEPDSPARALSVGSDTQDESLLPATVGAQANAGAKAKAKAKTKDAITRQRSSRSKMRVVSAGILLLTAAFAAIAIGGIVALALPAASDTWQSFVGYAKWIIPAVWLTGLLCCVATPRRAETRTECWGAILSMLAVVVCVAVSDGGIGGWTWLMIGVAAALHAGLIESYLADLSAFAELKKSEKLAELLISATWIGYLGIIAAGIVWLVGAPAGLLNAMTVLCIVLLIATAAGIAYLLFQVGRGLRTELQRGAWAR